MKKSKRILIITGSHLAISLIIFVTAIILTAKGIPSYPKHIHPLIFIIIQRVINFPLVLLASYVFLLVAKTFQMRINIYAILATTLISIPFNSLIWGFCIDKIIRYREKKKKINKSIIISLFIALVLGAAFYYIEFYKSLGTTKESIGIVTDCNHVNSKENQLCITLTNGETIMTTAPFIAKPKKDSKISVKLTRTFILKRDIYI